MARNSRLKAEELVAKGAAALVKADGDEEVTIVTCGFAANKILCLYSLWNLLKGS